MKSSDFSFYHHKSGHRLTFTSCVLFLVFSQLTFSQSWNALGSGTSGTINAEIIYNNDLVVAGSFTTAGGVTVNNIARWNGTTWSSIGGGTNGEVHALAIFNNQLIAGGSFTSAGGVTAYRIAVWNGSSWASLSLGMNGNVYALAVHSAQLVAGGAFTTAGGVNVNRIARWNGASWSIGTYYGFNDDVYALAPFNSDLIAAGRFTMSGTFYITKRITRMYISGSYYFPAAMGSGIDTGVANALTVYNSQLYVGGKFPTIGGITVNNIAAWSGTNWSYMGTGVNDTVCSLSTFGDLIVGGTFTSAGATITSRIARWNGSSWYSLGTGMTGTTPCVGSIITWQNVLVAGGTFANAGGVSVNNIAGWGNLPLAPTLVYPPDGANGIPVTLTFIWNPVTSGSSYGMQVSGNANFTTLLIDVSSLSTPQFTVPPPGLSYQTLLFWRANAKNGLGSGPWSLIRYFTTSLVGIINPGEIPLEFNLYQNYPNPFNPTTTISFDVPSSSIENQTIRLVIYDIQGREVTVIANHDYIAGKYELTLDADKAGLTSGVYFLKLTAGEYSAVNKLVVLK